MDQPRKKRAVRGPDAGNLLWKLYSELGATRRNEFKAALAAEGINYWEFNQDGQANKELGKLAIYRAAVYIAFFGEEFGDAIIPQKTLALREHPRTATQQFDENEHQPFLRAAV